MAVVAATLAITHAAMVIMLTRDNSDSVYSINNFIHMWQCSTAVIAITDAVKVFNHVTTIMFLAMVTTYTAILIKHALWFQQLQSHI